MSKSKAIIANRLSKEYRLGELYSHRSLRDALSGLFKRRRSRRGAEKRTIWAVKDVSFEVEEGEVLGVVGRNGAGKSTLLKLLSRITYPTYGSIKIRGRVAALLEVGTGFHQELTGRENIYLNGSILGMKKREIDAKLDEIVAFADVDMFLDTPIKRYSSGMRLRLGFAVAAHLEPDVLLVDEVLAVGDMGFQKKCISAMDDLHAGGRTVVFVSHNMAAVENLCPRAIWIDGGKVRDDGDSRSVIQHYLSTFSTADASSADLRDVEGRRGSGEARYTRVEILDSEGQPQSMVRTGGSFCIRLYYEAFKKISQPHFGVEVYTNFGTLVTSLNTWTTGLNVESIPVGAGHIDVDVDSFPLVPDRYYLSFWLASVGPKYDHVDHCLVLDVEAADVHDTGRELDTRFGIMYMPCKWHLPSNESGAAAAALSKVERQVPDGIS